MHGFYVAPWPRVDPGWFALKLNLLRDTPASAAKQVIPRLLLSIILASIDMVGHARRDILRRKHASVFATAEAKPGVASITCLLHGAN